MNHHQLEPILFNNNSIPLISQYKKQPSRITKYLYLLSFLFVCFILYITYYFLSSNQSHSYKILAINSSIKKPITDNRHYEIILLSNHLSITLISDTQASRNGLSLTINHSHINSHSDDFIINPFKMIQSLLINSQHGQIFQRHLKHFTGTFSFNVTDYQSHYYFHIDSLGFKASLTLFKNMLFVPRNYSLEDIESAMEKTFIHKDYEEYIVKNIIANTINDNSQEKKGSSNGDSMSEMIQVIHRIIENDYVVSRMKMAIVSYFTIDIMKLMVDGIFSSLPYQRMLNTMESDTSLHYQRLSLRQFIWYKSSMDDNKLTITYYMNEYNLKGITVIEYFVYMLQGNHPGSLYNQLIQKKLIETLNASVIKSPLYGIQLELSMIITIDALLNIEIIVTKCFNYIEIIKKNHEEILHKTYNDFKAMLEKKFLYMTIDKYSTYLTQITTSMHYTPIDSSNPYWDIIYDQYALPEYNQETMKRLFDNLIVNNTVITLGSRNDTIPYTYFSLLLEKEDMYKKHERLQNIDYYSKRINSKEFVEMMRNTYNYIDQYFLKTKGINMYMTQLNHIVIPEGSKEDIDREINDFNTTLIQEINEKNIKLWYKIDRSYHVPKIHSFFHLIFPYIRADNPKVYKTIKAFKHQLSYLIQYHFKEANICGNIILLSTDENGINIEIAAYEDVYTKILSTVLDIIFSPKKLTNSQSDDSSLYHSKEDKSLSYLSFTLKYFAYMYTNDDIIIYPQDLLSFWKETIKSFHVKGLIYGVVSEDIIRRVDQLLHLHMNNADSSNNGIGIEQSLGMNFMGQVIEFLHCHVSFEGVVTMRKTEHFFNSDRNYYISFIKVNNRSSTEDNALTCLFVSLMKEFTKKTIQVEEVYKDSIIYIRVIMMSKFKRPEELNELIDRRFKEFKGKIMKMTIEEFKDAKSKVYDELTRKDLRLRYKARKVWSEIYEETFDFKRYDNIAGCLLGISVNQMISFYKRILCSEKIQRLSFQLYHDPLVHYDLSPSNYYLNDSLKVRYIKGYNLY